jgi:hypothetical protein
MTWSKKYSDAGILPTDSIEVAREKVKNSAIYREEIRPPKNDRIGFTKTQSNKGAANAEVSESDFANFSTLAKNYFVNGMAGINEVKKQIDQAFEDGKAENDIENEISSDTELPDEVKNYLVKYLKEVYGGGALQEEQLYYGESGESWWDKLKSFFN